MFWKRLRKRAKGTGGRRLPPVPSPETPAQPIAEALPVEVAPYLFFLPLDDLQYNILLADLESVEGLRGPEAMLECTAHLLANILYRRVEGEFVRATFDDITDTLDDAQSLTVFRRCRALW